MFDMKYRTKKDINKLNNLEIKKDNLLKGLTNENYQHIYNKISKIETAIIRINRSILNLEQKARHRHNDLSDRYMV